VAPAVLIVVTVWACNLLADAIRDVSGQAGRAFSNRRPKRRRPLALPQGGA
jgi:peptide/nickel transport system permease protein